MVATPWPPFQRALTRCFFVRPSVTAQIDPAKKSALTRRYGRFHRWSARAGKMNFRRKQEVAK